MRKLASIKRLPVTLTDKIAAARDELEESTANVQLMVRRNEFIGKPVTSLEEGIRKIRDIAIGHELARAKRALVKITEAARA